MTLEQACQQAQKASIKATIELYVYADPDTGDPVGQNYEYGGAAWLDVCDLEGFIEAVYLKGKRIDDEDNCNA